VLDVDAEEAEAQAVNRFGSIPETFTVQTPRGGKHYYFRYSGKCRIKNGTNILGIKKLDLRADEGYVIAPPSKGDKGGYKVINAHSPVLIPDWLEDSQRASEYSENVEKTEKIERTENTEAISEVSAISAISDTVSVDRVIQATLPAVQGERNRRILDLARGLKYDCGLANEKLINVRPYVQQWHKLALPVIGTKPFEDTWEDFVSAWKAAKHSLLISPLLTAHKRAQGGDLPAEAKEYDNDHTKLLIGICWHLSRDKSRRFFLSSHKAGKLLGIPSATALKRLQMLIADEVLELDWSGNQHKANRYIWIGSAQAK
jgi:hypothetical protein